MASDPADDARVAALVEAATVVLVRPGPEGVEVLMGQRPTRHSFGGLWVFPGGRVESEDESSSQVDVEDPALEALERSRIAAVREAVEEFAVDLDPRGLVALSHWTPPPQAPRRFATWFFVAAVSGDPEIRVDGDEILAHRWSTAEQMMSDAAEGRVELAIPTWMTLAAIAACGEVDEILERAANREPSRYATRLARRDGIGMALWAGDAGYDSGDLDLVGPRHRAAMGPGRWHLEGDPWSGPVEVGS